MTTPTPTVAHAEGMRRALYYTASEMGRLQLEALDLERSESDRRLVQSLYAYEARGALDAFAESTRKGVAESVASLSEEAMAR